MNVFQIIFGPMFSGKTTELIRRIKRYELANHKCIVVKVTDNIIGSNDHLTIIQFFPSMPMIYGTIRNAAQELPHMTTTRKRQLLQLFYQLFPVWLRAAA